MNDLFNGEAVEKLFVKVDLLKLDDVEQEK